MKTIQDLIDAALISPKSTPEVTLYWDRQDTENVGPAWRTADDSGRGVYGGAAMTTTFEIPTFESQLARQQELEAAVNAADKTIKGFPRGPMGLTPDHIKAMPEWRAADSAYHSAAKALRNFNGPFIKAFKKQILAARLARRGY